MLAQQSISLHAPAGQLSFCLSDARCMPCVLGFNDVSGVRAEPMVDLPGTFRDIYNEMARVNNAGDKRCFFLHPVVGPVRSAREACLLARVRAHGCGLQQEAVCGSTRLKGGSATKLLLEVGALAFIATSIRLTARTRLRLVLLCRPFSCAPSRRQRSLRQPP
jgi:hypothetical protein